MKKKGRIEVMCGRELEMDDWVIGGEIENRNMENL